MAERLAYKVMTVDEFARMQRDQVFDGSAMDRADGFIHLSTGSQLAETVDRHFHGQPDLMVVAVDLGALGAAVRWEPSRGGVLFPHIHGTLPMAAVLAASPLERGADGAVVLTGAAR
jgi:uncharacterized protein (DUF952 family)